VIGPLSKISELDHRNTLWHATSVVGFRSGKTAFSIRSPENVLCSVRIVEDASSTSMVGSLNIDHCDKSSDQSSVKAEEKGIMESDATSDIILWPEGILVRLVDFRLNVHVAHFFQLCHIQHLSEVTPHFWEVVEINSFVVYTLRGESFHIGIVNCANSLLGLSYPISEIGRWMYLAFASIESH